MPLIAFSGVPAHAFPNVGVSLYGAIQKQKSELKKQNESGAFKFGILGSLEFKTVNNRFRPQWESLVSRINSESDIYERCSVSAVNCPPKLRQWRELIKSLKGLPAKVQLARLNKSINQMVTYAEDEEIFGQEDYWATPREFFNGRGDCEDYVAVKFWSLLELGFSNDQLRFAIVMDRKRKIMHAVVTVETGGKNYVLDSLFDDPVEQKYVLKYAPVFSANLDSQWAHIVTRKIRVSYVNQLENRRKGLVIQVKAKRQVPSKVTPLSGAIGLAARKDGAFVDWWT